MCAFRVSQRIKRVLKVSLLKVAFFHKTFGQRPKALKVLFGGSVLLKKIGEILEKLTTLLRNAPKKF